MEPRLPASGAEPEPLRPTGRGLAVVAALADAWDTVPYPPSGKTVRAVLSATPAV